MFDAVQQRLLRLQLAMLLAFGLVALALVFWGVTQRSLALRDDNPRLVEAELRTARGQILDTSGEVLADFVREDPGAFPASRGRRIYPVQNPGPAVGYYSLRYGTAGVEDGYDAVLRGSQSPLATLRHEPLVGRDIRLTLNIVWQQAASRLLGERPGAVALLTISDGALRVMVSQPDYDPNLLDDTFETLVADAQAPLLNRVTQGLYQPGLVLQPFVLAGLWDQELITFGGLAPNATEAVAVDGAVRRCLSEPPLAATWADVLTHVCPGPLPQMADGYGAAALAQLFQGYLLTSAPNLPLATVTGDETTVGNAALAIIGQEALTVSPLQVLLAWASLANDGVVPAPRLVEAVRASGGRWSPVAPRAAATSGPVTSDAAAAVLSALPRGERIISHQALVLSGPAGVENSWYLGLAPAAAPQFAVVVVLEGVSDIAAAEALGRELLTLVALGDG